MKEVFKKIAENKARREETLYKLDEDWTHYGPNCPEHVGVRRLLVGDKEKEKLGYDAGDIVWKCPVDGEIFHGEGSTAEQTDGFSLENNFQRPIDPMEKDSFDAVDKLSKAMGFGDAPGGGQ